MRSPIVGFSLPAFLALVVGGGLAIGLATAPDEWYWQLRKPAFNPPSWVFGPIWTSLYFLIAVAGWRVWERNRGGLSMKLWWAQLGLNFLWSPVFFSARQIGLALGILVMLLVIILRFIATSRQDPLTMWLFLPYLVWVAFATVLNAAILVLN